MGRPKIEGKDKAKEMELIELAEKIYEQLQNKTADESTLEEAVIVALACMNQSAAGTAGFRLLERAAAQGSARAQFNVGNCYFAGDFVDRDHGKAREWFEKSAEQGYASAINNLGECYLRGYGCEADPAKGFELIKDAASRHNIYAFDGMGYCYYFGTGTERDPDKARYWWEKAAAAGNRIGQDNLIEHFGYDAEALSIRPYEILKNAFNSARFDDFILMLDDNVIYESLWHRETFEGKKRVGEHLSSTAKNVRASNVITRASVAEITGESGLASRPDGERVAGRYCVLLETPSGTAVVLMEGKDDRIERISICRSDTVEYKVLNFFNTMTREEIHDFGTEIVCGQLVKEGYRILMHNPDFGTYPQIVAEKEGVRYVIVVETEVAPFTGRLGKGASAAAIRYAMAHRAVPCFASVGIGSANQEWFENGIAIRNEGFYARYCGLETIGLERLN